MQCLFQTSVTLSPKDRRRNIEFDFAVPNGLQALVLRFSYSPKNTDDLIICEPLIRECLDDYWPSGHSAPDWRKYLPLQNLITVSLDHDGVFAGGAHRHAPQQEHTLSATEASPGFHKQPELAGSWRAVVSTHEILTDSVTVELSAWGVLA